MICPKRSKISNAAWSSIRGPPGPVADWDRARGVGRHDRAIADFTATLAINPLLRAIWNNRRQRRGSRRGIIRTPWPTTLSPSKWGQARELLQPPLAWGRLGATEKADRDMAKALELDPNFGPAKRHDFKQEPADQKVVSLKKALNDAEVGKKSQPYPP